MSVVLCSSSPRDSDVFHDDNSCLAATRHFMRPILLIALLCAASVECIHSQEAQLQEAFLKDKAKAEQGDAEAQYALFLRYWNGIGVEKSLAESAKWLRKAAEKNHAKAQTFLGAAYMRGD